MNSIKLTLEEAMFMIQYYHKNEYEYEKWLRENKNSFVFNHFGTVEMNKMHHSRCYHLHRTKDSGSRTNYEKLCSNSYISLENEANRVTKNKWSQCKVCFM